MVLPMMTDFEAAILKKNSVIMGRTIHVPLSKPKSGFPNKKLSKDSHLLMITSTYIDTSMCTKFFISGVVEVQNCFYFISTEAYHGGSAWFATTTWGRIEVEAT